MILCEKILLKNKERNLKLASAREAREEYFKRKKKWCLRK